MKPAPPVTTTFMGSQATVPNVTTRVLWISKGLGPGGAETLLAAAAAARSPEFEVECAYVLPWKDHLAGRLESADVVTRCVSTRRSDPMWPLHLWRLVRSGDYDVVHVHSPLPGSVARLAARTLPRDRRPALVSTEHNRWETHRAPTRALNRLTSRLDDRSFAVTDEVRDSMQGPVADRAVTLRHGIDIDATAAELEHRDEIRAELGLSSDEFVVGTVANFRPQKDYPNLFEAARQLADRDVTVRIVAVGQGPQDAELRGLRSELGLDDRVLLTGFRADAVRVMAACDAFVMASQWEGLPVAIMEATGLGLPIVSTAVGGIAEEFDDGVDALLVPPHDATALADALERVATDRELRTRLAQASRERAADFGVARTVAVIEKAYDELSSGRPGPDTADTGGATPKRPPRPAPDIRHATPDDRPAVIELLGRSLGSDGDPRYPRLFEWKHELNPFGASPMWVATDGDRIIGLRTLMRWEFVRGGSVLRAVRAVDTATDPDYQGRGLFTALTLHGIEAMRTEGVDFVFNTPNDQSRPGYLKMGWREVGRMPAAVRFSGPNGAVAALRSRVPADRWSQSIDVGDDVNEWLDRGGPGDRRPEPVDVRELRTNSSAGYLRWRFGTDLLGYRVVDDGEAAVIVRARRRGASTELALVASFGPSASADRLAARAAREVGAAYAIRLGQPQMSSGFVPLPSGGPMLTWRGLVDVGAPPLSNWALELGDIELF
jgi:glycosyltransferase involved in cell wall biosynthesis/GNAT superfamily N-acetyltransferase